MSSPDRPAAAVPKNRWDQIPVPELGEWSPTLTVTVVLPYYERPEELERTLAGLNAQTYPAHLLQAIIVDDGSPNEPPRPQPGLRFDVRVVRQEDRGYGLTRARNLGARLAEGEIVVFLDCDMIPERQLVEAHARWHHQARRLMTLGFRRHAEFGEITPEQISEAVRGDSMASLFRPEDVSIPEWIEAHMMRTEQMLSGVDDLYSLMSGGNLGVDRDFYWEVGGNDESFTRWGGEDNEFAFRALVLGGVFVPERRALAWHQGEGHEASDEEVRSLRLQRPKIESLIANPVTRRSDARIHARPRLTVFIDPGSAEFDMIGTTVDSVLASDFRDLVVGVGPVSGESHAWLEEAFGKDPRVVVAVEEPELMDRFRLTPVRLRLPAGFAVSAGTIDSILQRVSGEGVGQIHITLPGIRPREGMASAWLTRAENRARSIGEDVSTGIARLFGEWWVSGTSLGLWAIEDIDRALLRIRSRLGPHDWDRYELIEYLLWKANQRIEELEGRRALLLADGIGQVLRARNMKDLRFGMSAIGRAFRRRRHSAQ